MRRNQKCAMSVIGLGLAGVLGAVWAAESGVATVKDAEMVRPSEWIRRQRKPVFRPGHTLPPLTRYGWTLDFDTRVELTENWGYALEFGGYVTEKSVEKLKNLESVESRVAALAASDPKRYPLSVICSRRLPGGDQVPTATWARDADGNLLNGKAESMDGTKWHKGMKPIYSPAAADSVWQEAGRFRAEPIKAVRDHCPIAIVLNGGEYGLGVLGFAQKVWEKDPAILAAKGDKEWFPYISERKAHAETLIADAVKAVVPDRQLYIYYPTGGCPHRHRTKDWWKWCYGYEWMKQVSDLASTEHYYRHFNCGWVGKDDLLTLALNARGFEIAQGQPFCYDWLCAGWPREKGLGSGAPDPLGDGGLGDIRRYTGFLKCMYVAGMLGGNAGYYAYPKGGFGREFPADSPPHWLRQMLAFARVHALFSRLEERVREGVLVPGPDMHVWSKHQPAYELPTGDEGVRVVARKHRKTTEWLVVAWSAAGTPRDVTVTIPELGPIDLFARPAGSVYLVAATPDGPRKHLFDRDEELPSLSFQK